jgi:Fic family protein
VVVFLDIHPFQDGNGRLSCVLTTLLLLQAGYAYVPYSSLESIIEQNKQGYYMALRQTQGSIRTEAPNWQPWVVFFLRALASQVKRLEAKISNEEKLLSQMPVLSVQLIDLARNQGRATVAQAVELTQANRNTVRTHLKQHGSAGRGVWYGLS